MSSAKPRDRKCATCRFYEPSPLWRRGWCRNPLLYDPHTNHLVEADSLACSRTFIDYWEARPPGQKGASTEADPNNPLIRRAPSIPLTPTGPGGAPLRGNGATVAAVQAAYQPRDQAPQLSLVRPAAPPAEPPAPVAAAPPVAATQPLEQMAPARPTPTAARTPPSNAVVAGRPEPGLDTEDRRRTQSVLAGALILTLGVLAFLFLRAPHGATATPTPAAPTAGLGAVLPAPSLPAAPPLSATPPPKPTLVPTPVVLALRPGANVQMTGLNGVSLNIRQAPTTKGRILAGLPANVTVRIVAGPQTADGVTWWQITGWDAKGSLGWASAKFLKPVP